MHRIAVLAFEGISPFHLSVPCLVFGDGFKRVVPQYYEVTVAGTNPGRMRVATGFDIVVEHGLDVLTTADTIVVPSADLDIDPDPAVIDALRLAHANGKRLVGLCLGAFTLAAAGILEHREAVTHWAFTDELARRHPNVKVRPDVLWSDHTTVLTSAGVAASLDCCLHVVRGDTGVDAASTLARYLVMAPHREGNQAQYLTTPVMTGDANDPIERAMVWARSHLGEPIDLDRWSREVALSRRTFTRRFRDRTGLSCGDWLIGQRLEHVRLLLEKTGDTVEQVAEKSGFVTAQVLRHHFRIRLDTTPVQYRRSFKPTVSNDSDPCQERSR